MSHLLSFKQVKPYHNNKGLLFQFILSELILASKEIDQIEKLTVNLSSPSPSDLLETLTPHFTSLIGTTHSYMRLLYWDDNGILTKLRKYTALLCQAVKSKNSDLAALSREASHAWFTASTTLDMIRTLLVQAWHEGGIIDIKRLLVQIKKISRWLLSFIRIIGRTVVLFRTDENVLLFILNHQEDLSIVFGKQAAAKFFQKLFPKNMQNGKTLLLDKFGERGFYELLPAIQQKFALLDAP